MQITGSYSNYQNLSSLLSPLGVKQSGDLIMGVFSASMNNLQNKINNQIFSKESSTALTKLYNEVSGLAEKATKLTTSDMSSVFNDRTATSSDTSVLTATAFDAFSQDSGATEAAYDISVTQLAQTQENTGLELNGTDSTAVDLGTNTFNISINGQDHELSIEVVEEDTNEAILQKMEQAINDASIGVKAQVTDGTAGGTKELVITSDSTGATGAFAITDVSGNAVMATGADSISTGAQDAAYAVDGTDYTSGSNTVNLDDGMVTVDLSGVGETTLKVGPDENEVENAISGLVSGVNSLIGFLENNSEYIKDDVLSSVNSIIADHKNELKSFGITLGEDGKLEIDPDELTSAVNENPSTVKESFGGFDGLAVEIDNYPSSMTTDSPLNYAKESEGMSKDFKDFVYSSSAGMLQQMLQGMVLDQYV
jgi:flagellar hook-associated protein 2